MVDEQKALNKELGIDIENELKQSEFKGRWWKVEEGTHDVPFLSEPKACVYVDPNGLSKQQVLFLVDRKKDGLLEWSIPRSFSSTSLWVQLCKWAKKRGGKFVGGVARIKVLGNGKNRRYTVLD